MIKIFLLQTLSDVEVNLNLSGFAVHILHTFNEFTGVAMVTMVLCAFLFPWDVSIWMWDLEGCNNDVGFEHFLSFGLHKQVKCVLVSPNVNQGCLKVCYENVIWVQI